MGPFVYRTPARVAWEMAARRRFLPTRTPDVVDVPTGSLSARFLVAPVLTARLQTATLLSARLEIRNGE